MIIECPEAISGGIEIKRLDDSTSPIAIPAAGGSMTVVAPPATPAVYAVYRDGAFQTFFRVLEPRSLTTYEITRTRYRGLPVLQLDGGMSAEYAVEKAGEVLSGGIAHSWEVSRPGHGPNPVFATPSFLIDAIDRTTAFYDDLLGKDAAIDTVILSTGAPSMPYIANALGAPILPLHFLASADSVREIQTILERSADSGVRAYSTLAQDPSVDHAVAWVKLLGVPPEYKAFLLRHRVKNVVLIGSTNTSDGGETAARRLVGLGDPDPYGPGSIYIMYPGTAANEEETLKERIHDIADYQRDPQTIDVVDWESGISPPQIEGVHHDIAEYRLADNLVVLTSDHLIDIYDLGTYVSAALLARNGDGAGDLSARGFALNPYLVSHPSYETWKRWLPVVFFQGVDPQATFERLTVLAERVERLFLAPGQQIPRLVRLNLTRNFGGPGAGRRYAIIAERAGWRPDLSPSATDADEVWNPADGIQSISEQAAEDILDHETASAFRQWNSHLGRLEVDELSCFTEALPRLKIKWLLGMPQPCSAGRAPWERDDSLHSPDPRS